MIPTFPEFTAIADVDAREFEGLIAGHLPYSDFNLLSIRCYWPAARVARYGDGVALLLSDYFTGEPCLTVLSRIHGTRGLDDLLTFASEQGCGARLRCVPECSIGGLGRVTATERADTFDYVLSTDAMLTPTSAELRRKHRCAERFRLAHPGVTIREASLHSLETRSALETVNRSWLASRHQNKPAIAEREAAAFEQLVLCDPEHHLVCVVAFSESGEAVGFTISEPLREDWCLAHFDKAISIHRGLSEWIWIETARQAHDLGCRLINFQEDLGLEGLRRMKRSWQPVRFLRKYDVCRG